MPKVILIVDPDHDTRVKLRYMVESLGHVAVSTTCGDEARSILKNITAPSLILIATQLVRISGKDFCRQLGSDPDFSKIPLIQMTNPGDLPFDPAITCLMKPVSSVQLSTLLSQF